MFHCCCCSYDLTEVLPCFFTGLQAGLARPAAATYMTTVALLAIASFCGYSTVAATA